MPKSARIVLAAIAMFLGLGVGRAGAAPPVECQGTVTLLSQSNIEVTALGSRTITEFDYTANHTLCLRDGTVVDATQTGHLKLNQRVDGTGTVTFRSVVAHDAGTFRGDGTGQIDADGVISGRARVHSGTGSLAGTTGHGWFRSTGPGTFEDVIWYSFHGPESD